MTSPSTIRILIADDHALFRSGLRMLLESQSDFQVVAEAANSTEAVALTRQLRPEILLLDLNMPPVSGLTALKEISTLPKIPKTILLTASFDKNQQREASQLGAHGFILKESAAGTLIKCIRCIYAGNQCIENDCSGVLLNKFHGKIAVGFEAFSAVKNYPFGLTSREQEIALLVASGYSNKDITSELNIGIETVKQHLKNIFDKVGVSSRIELTLMVLHHKLVDDSHFPN
jgi:two-component system, NarL family, nitrate/nitrite response regulator NarL